jgi:probable rRNA maturation factor
VSAKKKKSSLSLRKRGEGRGEGPIGAEVSPPPDLPPLRGEGGFQVLCASTSSQAKRLTVLARSFAKTLKLSNAELSLSLVRDPAIRKLKREYFGIDAATDVLSFPAGEFPGPGPRPLGDIVISVDTAKRQAKDLHTTVERELALYLAHGLLHLLGHDHQTVKDARRMERLERNLLGHAGMLARSDEV